MVFFLNQFDDEMRALLAEDIGFHLGDGHMSASTRDSCFRYSFTYCGDMVKDKDYFLNKLIPRKVTLFGLRKKEYIFNKKRSAIYYSFNSRHIFKFFYEMGIPSGRKTNMKIPSWIMRGNKEIKSSVLRGLIDSDGCFTVKRKYKSNPYYPVITFSSKSKNLIEDIQILLSEFSILYTVCLHKRIDNRNGRKYSIYQIDINGKERVNKWINHIGFNNKRHIIKYERWARGDLNSRSLPFSPFGCEGSVLTN